MTPGAPLRYRRWWQLAGWMLLVIVAVNALAPWPEVPDAPAHMDKYLHAATFFVLTLWFCGAFDRERWVLVALGLFLFGAAIEIAQGRTGYRTAEVADMVANTLGLVAGYAVSLAGAAGWCRLVESRLPGGERA